ncbi:hypothetical protein CLAIMM_13764 [Cladophialophora immunda]|nr:hypothetical protein CLAIMM_13764 [Cladophialophora immunda]
MNADEFNALAKANGDLKAMVTTFRPVDADERAEMEKSGREWLMEMVGEASDDGEYAADKQWYRRVAQAYRVNIHQATEGSSIGVFVLGRLLQGSSSAFTLTAGITLAVESVREEEVGKTMGIYSLGMSLALLTAPIVKGLLLHQGGYHSVFCLAFVLDDMQAVSIKIEGGIREERRSATFGSGSTISLLRDRRLQAALWVRFAATTLIASLDAVLPIFVRDTFSWGSQGAALIFIPVVLPTFLSPYVGALTDRYGAKWVAGSAFMLGCPVWVLMRLVSHVEAGQVVLLYALLALLGVTTALMGPALMAETTFTVKRRIQEQPGTLTIRNAVVRANALHSLSLAGGLLAGPLWGGVIKKVVGYIHQILFDRFDSGNDGVVIGTECSARLTPELCFSKRRRFRLSGMNDIEVSREN